MAMYAVSPGPQDRAHLRSTASNFETKARYFEGRSQAHLQTPVGTPLKPSWPSAARTCMHEQRRQCTAALTV